MEPKPLLCLRVHSIVTLTPSVARATPAWPSWCYSSKAAHICLNLITCFSLYLEMPFPRSVHDSLSLLSVLRSKTISSKRTSLTILLKIAPSPPPKSLYSLILLYCNAPVPVWGIHFYLFAYFLGPFLESNLHEGRGFIHGSSQHLKHLVGVP